MDRYVILEAEYEPHAKDAERSLRWLVPELVEAGLTMTEHTPGVRNWAGVIDGDTYERFAAAWDLGNKADARNGGVPTDGHLAQHSYTWDGMEWDLGGWSPIIWMNLKVSEPIEAQVHPRRARSTVRLLGLSEAHRREPRRYGWHRGRSRQGSYSLPTMRSRRASAEDSTA